MYPLPIFTFCLHFAPPALQFILSTLPTFSSLPPLFPVFLPLPPYTFFFSYHLRIYTLYSFTPTYVGYSLRTGAFSYMLLLLLSPSVRSQLCDPMDCSLPGSSVHGILQARVLEWVAMPSSRGSSQSIDQTWVSCVAGRCFTTEPPEKPFS